MSNGEKKTKDAWDKIDIIGKLLTGIVIGFLALAEQTKFKRVQSRLQQLKKMDSWFKV